MLSSLASLRFPRRWPPWAVCLGRLGRCLLGVEVSGRSRPKALMRVKPVRAKRPSNPPASPARSPARTPICAPSDSGGAAQDCNRFETPTRMMQRYILNHYTLLINYDMISPVRRCPGAPGPRRPLRVQPPPRPHGDAGKAPPSALPRGCARRGARRP